MSINHFTNKIKDKLSIDTFTIMCFLIIIGVGVSAFGLGRLSMNNNISQKEEFLITNISSQLNSTDGNLKEKRYVASKNGKLYYSLGCSGAKRISLKNKIWFTNSEEAKKSGYKFSKSCK